MPFRPLGETLSYEGQVPQTVSAVIYQPNPFPVCFGVPSPLDSTAKADPQILPEHLLIRSVSCFPTTQVPRSASSRHIITSQTRR